MNAKCEKNDDQMRTAEEKKPAANGTHTSPFFNKGSEHFFAIKPESNTFFQKSSSPFIQPKLAIGQPNEKYEREADAVAQQVVSSSDPTIQAKCAGCEKEEHLQKQSVPGEEELQMQPIEEEEEILQTQSMDEEEDLQKKPSLQLKNDATVQSRTEASRLIQSRINSSRGSGRLLDSTTRNFMENRMHTDFSRVNIHTGEKAVQMNRDLGARAFTAGSDIYFNKGEYRPETNEGKKLLAHELTHTVQQGAVGTPHIQRMRIGAGNPPQRFAMFNGRPVPQDDREVVSGAIEKIREVVNNPSQYPKCHNYFRDECPTAGRNSLPQMFNNAVLWKADKPGALAFTWANTHDIAYTQSGYNSGSTHLARTLVHELLHNCGIPSGDSHHLADVAGLYCIGNDNDLLVSMGPALGADIIYLMISYRRLLRNLASGHIQLNAGTDINVMGIGSEIGSAISGIDLTSGEFASLTLGLRGRANIGWGGERYGGITGNLDLGLDVGRFRLSDASPEASTEITPGFVMQAGLGAEFYIPIGAEAIPVSINAMYRMVRPLNPQAEMIHGLLGGIGFSF